jgi:hypothetical protein
VNDPSIISTNALEDAYSQLLAWCRQRNFAGHDPFDALNSEIFQKTPLASSRKARLIWTQLLKRSPVDFRNLLRVPAQPNAKGIALFALAQLARYRTLKTPKSEYAARELLSTLREMKLSGYSGPAWGYNFDWQSRNFFAPRGSATIVPTAFAGRAFLEGARALGDDDYFKEAQSICQFIVNDLPRSVETATEVCFSYAPNTATQIFNASLLAAEMLAEVGGETGDKKLKELATKATRFVLNHQGSDGSWSYGMEPSQIWFDNFHTAYVLFSLARIQHALSLTSEVEPALKKGFEFWKNSFFLADGWPKYYHAGIYPADIHAGASAIVTFVELSDLDSIATPTAEKIAHWSIANMHDEQGFFYYQRRRFHTVRKPFMRWSQAWMLYALARLLEQRSASDR